MTTFKCFLIANLKIWIFILAFVLFAVANIRMDGDFEAAMELVKDIFINSASLTIFIILSIVGIIFSIIIAKYAYDNFDEVVSRRMRFRSSKVDMMEEGIYYWVVTFIKSLIFCTLASLTLIILCSDMIMG